MTGDWWLETDDWRLMTGDWWLMTGDWWLMTGDWVLMTGDIVCHLSSVIQDPSSIICHPSSVIRHLSSVICHLSFVISWHYICSQLIFAQSYPSLTLKISILFKLSFSFYLWEDNLAILEQDWASYNMQNLFLSWWAYPWWLKFNNHCLIYTSNKSV